MFETDPSSSDLVPHVSPAWPVLRGLMDAADRARLERENRRLERRLRALSEEVTHLRARQRLDRMLVERESSLRLAIVAELRALVKGTGGTAARRPAVPIPKRYPPDEIPSFLRSGMDAEAAAPRAIATKKRRQVRPEELEQRLAERRLAWLRLGW